MSIFTRHSLDRHCELHDAGLGPALLAPYATDLADRAARCGPRHVLELATGTGILTRALRKRLPEASLTVTEVDTEVLARARRGAAAEMADPGILPFGDADFDLAACQFGIPLFPRKTDFLQEIARVVRPGGTLLFNCWGPIGANRFAEVAGDALARILGSPLPEAWAAPYSYADPHRVTRDLRAAGWCRIHVTAVAATARIIDAGDFARGLVLGSPTVADLREAGIDPRDAVAAVAAALGRAFGATAFRTPLDATVYTCHTP